MTPVTYGELRDASNRLANAFRARGIGRGDRVAILLPQGATVPIVHVAIYKLGGPGASARGVVRGRCPQLPLADGREGMTNAAGLAKLAAITEPLAALDVVLSTDGADPRGEDLRAALRDRACGLRASTRRRTIPP